MTTSSTPAIPIGSPIYSIVKLYSASRLVQRLSTGLGVSIVIEAPDS